VLVRLIMMRRMSTMVPGQCCRRALARECICLESFERCWRGCGLCTIFIRLSESFNRGVSSSVVRVSNESRFEESDEVGFVGGGT
jgi:hypothetical protein